MISRIKKMKTWCRERNTLMQIVGIVATFSAAMTWMPLLFILMWYLDDLLLATRAQGLHWFCWLLYWVLAFWKVLTWFLYSAVDIDHDGFEAQ